MTPWTIVHQAPLSTGFSGQEYWSGLPFPFPGNLPDPGIEPRFPTLQADTLPSEPLATGRKFSQAPSSMGFSGQEYWSGLPFPSPGDLPDPGIEPRSPALQADAFTSEPPGKHITSQILTHTPQLSCPSFHFASSNYLMPLL